MDGGLTWDKWSSDLVSIFDAIHIFLGAFRFGYHLQLYIRLNPHTILVPRSVSSFLWNPCPKAQRIHTGDDSEDPISNAGFPPSPSAKASPACATTRRLPPLLFIPCSARLQRRPITILGPHTVVAVTVPSASTDNSSNSSDGGNPGRSSACRSSSFPSAFVEHHIKLCHGCGAVGY